MSCLPAYVCWPAHDPTRLTRTGQFHAERRAKTARIDRPQLPDGLNTVQS
jgi:hypothetical protein